MGSENKNQKAQNKGTFSVANDFYYLNLKIENSQLENFRNSTSEQTDRNTSKCIAGIDPLAIEKIEKNLKLTFLSEKDAESYVCMANSPEVRAEFKDVFDIKDLLNYVYAVLHSPGYLEKYKETSKVNFFQVIYPNDTSRFWKLVDLGGKLRYRDPLKMGSVEKQNKEIDEILKNIANIEIT